MFYRSLKQNQYFINPVLQKRINLDNETQKFMFTLNNLNDKISYNKQRVMGNKEKIIFNQMNIINRNKVRNNNIHEQLDNLNPLSILSRGYSVTKKDGISIKSVETINVGDKLDVMLSDGIIKVSVEDKERHGK